MRQQKHSKVTRDVAITMRDGVVLYADVFRPDDDEQHPVLLLRTPYNKADYLNTQNEVDIVTATSNGYVVVLNDVRGRYASEGEFKPFHQEINDGYDTVEWCGSQPWSNGKVGMFGTSYVGATQWLAAIGAPPSLKCIIPCFTASDYYEGWTYQGGAFEWGFMVNWVLPYFAGGDLWRTNDRTPLPDYEQRRDGLIAALDNMIDTARTLPLNDFPIDHQMSPYLREWLSHPERDDFWKAVSIEDRHNNIHVPAYNHGGWYDIFLEGTIRNFTGVRKHGATEEARTGSRLSLGAWTHTNPPSAFSGAIDFGMHAGQGLSPLTLKVHGEQMAFLDYWLKGIDNGISQVPPVKYYTMGECEWHYADEWPVPSTTLTDYYLHSGGSANSSAGDGSLSTDAPGAERPDRFLYDPFHPVPTNGGQTCCYPTRLAAGTFDQQELEKRTDVLMFVTPPLEQPVEVTGEVSLTLWAETTAPDTDFTGKLVDIAPDGTAMNLTDGIIRARYRNGTEKAELLEPGHIVEYTINMWSTSNLFREGHRIGLEVSSSNFPRFDRNLNTGREQASETEMRPAIQTIYHDSDRPSRLTLPIIPR